MSNIHGLNSLKNNKLNNSSDSGEEDDSRQGFYVGGSDRSGQQVLGPSNNANRNDVAERFFEAARNAGAEQISPDEANAAMNRTGASSSSFQGGAYRLGGHGQETQQIATSREQSAGNSRSVVVVNFNVWQNGFSLDDGPLRDFADSENRAFLEEIMRGAIPQELVRAHPGQKIDLHIIRKQAPYTAPKMKVFSGEGYRLGSIVPNVVGATPEVVELDKPSEDELNELLKKAQESVGVRNADPTTRVQIRLPDAPRPIVGMFNQNHSIADLRNFIVNARPSLAFRPFQLMTTYPSNVIDNEKDTLKDAELLNAVVNIKYV